MQFKSSQTDTIYQFNKPTTQLLSYPLRHVPNALKEITMKILILGSNGQLGWELCRQAPDEGFDIVPLDLPEFDITKPDLVTDVVAESKASVVINAAAYTAVDKAESEPELAFTVNRDGPTYLASACNEEEIPLIHISTDYVFDGNKKGPYLETDPVHPLGVYGKSKAEGETEVRKSLTKHMIIRTAWLYGIHGNNFVKTMLRLAQNQEIIRVVADQFGAPTYAGDLAKAVLSFCKMIKEGRDHLWGTYHYAGDIEISWHGFTEKIVEISKNYFPLKVREIVPITSDEYPTPARRPVNSVLECSRSTACGIERPYWLGSLKHCISSLQVMSGNK